MERIYFLKYFIVTTFFGLLVSCNNYEDNLFTKETIETNTNNPNHIEDGIDFFWYNGQKYYLIPDSTKYFIVYNEINESINAKVLNEGFYTYNPDESSLISTKKCNTTRAEGNSIQKWQVIENPNYIDTKSENPTTICYKSPYYKSQKTGNSIGISNLIHIKIKTEEDKKLLDKQLIKYNLSIFSHNKFMPLWYTVACKDDLNGHVLDICKVLHNSNLFEIVEPDIIIDLSLNEPSLNKLAIKSPNDPNYNSQWNLHATYSINWTEAHTISKGAGISIGIIDSGVDATHPDLISSRIHHVYDSYQLSWYTNGIYHFHGIACAGIMVAQTNNSKGIAGISPESDLNSISDSFLSRPNLTQNIATALYMAISCSDVVSCSWSGADLISSEITDAITSNIPKGRNNKGTVIVFSAGNDAKSSINYPGSCYPDILVVGSTDENGNRIDFSNYGQELDVMAPGINIPTLGYNSDGSLGYINDFKGTSASCPHVAAIAALILSVNPNLTNVEVNNIIEKTARKVGKSTYSYTSERKNGTWNKYMGYGLVDATAALKAAQATIK